MQIYTRITEIKSLTINKQQTTSEREYEPQEVSPVPAPYAVPRPGAVVIKALHAVLTRPAVLRPGGSVHVAHSAVGPAVRGHSGGPRGQEGLNVRGHSGQNTRLSEGSTPQTGKN